MHKLSSLRNVVLLHAEVHDVADAEAVRRAGVVDDDEATVEGEIGGHAEDLSVGQLDTNAPAQRRQLGTVAVTQLVGGSRQAVVGGEKLGEQAQRCDVGTQPACSVGRPADVDPDSNNHTSAGRPLGQHPGELAIVEEDVVWPFQRQQGRW